MFSGKTSLLINRYNRYIIGNKKCLMVKFKRDNRYDKYQVITHDGISINAIKCEYLYELDSVVYNYDVICIDEIQFYKDAHIMCDKWANDGLIVNACGLSGDRNRKPFPIISHLIAIADDIYFTKAVCKYNGNDAVYSQLSCSNSINSQELIGGGDIYNAVDRITYNNNKYSNNNENNNENKNNIRLELYKELINLYLDSINTDPTANAQLLQNMYDPTKPFNQIINNK